MVHGYIVLAIIIFVLYNATFENCQFATATDILQVWIGECYLQCRPGNHSDEGTSGFVVPIRTTNECTECVCESCLCVLIEKLLITCRPVTEAYNSSVDTVGQYCSDFMNRFYDLYDRVMRVLECRTSCRRHAQFVNPTPHYYDSNENVTLVENKEYSQRKKSAIVPSMSGARKNGAELDNKITDIAELPPSLEPEDLMAPSRSRISAPHSTTSTTKRTQSEVTLKPSKSSSELRKKCSKCVEQGKTCIGACPSADLKRKKYKK